MSPENSKRSPSRERLIGAARQLFHKNGFEKTTIAEISKLAGVTSRTFFRHFASKEEVLFADHERSVAILERELSASGPSRPVVDIVRSALPKIMQPFDQNPEQSLERFRLELSSRSVEATAIWVTQDWVRAITKDLASRMRVDPVEDPRPHLIASLANMAARLAIGIWVERDGRGSIRTLAVKLFDLMISGLDIEAERGPAGESKSGRKGLERKR